MAKIGFLVKLEPELIARLKAYAAEHKTTVAGILTTGAEQVMRNGAALDKAMARAAGAATVIEALPEHPEDTNYDASPLKCRRCGHLPISHWARGCVAGCMCRQDKYFGPNA